MAASKQHHEEVAATTRSNTVPELKACIPHWIPIAWYLAPVWLPGFVHTCLLISFTPFNVDTRVS